MRAPTIEVCCPVRIHPSQSTLANSSDRALSPDRRLHADSVEHDQRHLYVICQEAIKGPPPPHPTPPHFRMGSGGGDGGGGGGGSGGGGGGVGDRVPANDEATTTAALVNFERDGMRP